MNETNKGQMRHKFPSKHLMPHLHYVANGHGSPVWLTETQWTMVFWPFFFPYSNLDIKGTVHFVPRFYLNIPDRSIMFWWGDSPLSRSHSVFHGPRSWQMKRVSYGVFYHCRLKWSSPAGSGFMCHSVIEWSMPYQAVSNRHVPVHITRCAFPVFFPNGLKQV